MLWGASSDTSRRRAQQAAGTRTSTSTGSSSVQTVVFASVLADSLQQAAQVQVRLLCSYTRSACFSTIWFGTRSPDGLGATGEGLCRQPSGQPSRQQPSLRAVRTVAAAVTSVSSECSATGKQVSRSQVSRGDFIGSHLAAATIPSIPSATSQKLLHITHHPWLRRLTSPHSCLLRSRA